MGAKPRVNESLMHATELAAQWSQGLCDNYKDLLLEAAWLFEELKAKPGRARDTIEQVLREVTTAAEELCKDDPGMAEYLEGAFHPHFAIDTKSAKAKAKESKSRKRAAPKMKRRGICFVDTDGTPISDNSYQLAYSFSDGIAWVKVNGLWGAISLDGEVVIEPRFFAVASFSGGLAPVRETKNGKVGYVDRAGSWVVEPRFNYGSSFIDGYAVICDLRNNSKMSATSSQGREGGNWGAIDTEGNEAVALDKAFVGLGDGFLLVNEGGRHTGYGNVLGGQYEFVNPRTGDRIGKYQEATTFQDGLAVVSTRKGLNVIDVSGRPVGAIDADYVCGPFAEGRAVVSRGSKYFYVDERGDVVLGGFVKASPFHHGVAAVVVGGQLVAGEVKGGQRGYCTISGETFGMGKHQSVEKFADGRGLVWTKGGSRAGFLDRCGTLVIAPTLRWARPFSQGRAAVRV